MSSHIVASRHHNVTPDPERQAVDRLRKLDTLLLTPAALCRKPGVDPDDWFPLAESDDAYDTAAKRCHGCPFTGLAGPCVERAQLLPYAEVGVIGGTTPALRRQLGIGADLHGYDGVAA